MERSNMPLFMEQDLAAAEAHQTAEQKRLAEQAERDLQDYLAAMIEKMKGLPPLKDYPVKGKPLMHQQRALREADMRSGHAYWMDPGAGKTFTTIAEVGLAYQKDDLDGAIIAAPNGPHEQWIDEQFPEWADFPWYGFTNRLTPARTRKALEKAGHMGRDAFGVLAVNHDALRTEKGQKLIEQFRKIYPRTAFILDESQKMKDHQAARTQGALHSARDAVHTRALSGTPILKGIEDLWTQYEVSHPGQMITGFDNVEAFRNYYCIIERVWGAADPRATQIAGYKNEDELMRKTAPYVTRVMSDEFMKGEKPSFMKINCPMTREQSLAYRQMKDMLVTKIDSGLVSAKNALVGLQKLQQIASGFVYLGDELITETGWTVRPYEWIGDNKINATISLLESLDEPVIIWVPYRAALEHLMTKVKAAMRKREIAPRPFFTYEDRATINAWKEAGGILYANQAGGAGVGQNLQNAAANIYFSNTFAAEARWQSLKRTDRIGQTRQVRVWDLMSEDTVDWAVHGNLQRKEDISRSNIDAIREMI